jgi:phosphoribosylamine--glycine ligase
MRTLVLGGGGREHALCWALSRSPSVSSVHCAPGNAGIEKTATVHRLDISDPVMTLDLARSLSPDLVVIGPEAPLVAGLADV